MLWWRFSVKGLESQDGVIRTASEFSVCKRRKICKSFRSHLASGVWNLGHEEGNKLLASGLGGDCLYVCDWPRCIHIEEKRDDMLFRGIFKNFKRSRVWDLHLAFRLRVFGYNDDDKTVVRAYVCENGHVSGAWTDW
ncbi:hypothetical protein U1Q18_031679, partial [Sarracenia purpurea var. burkii]